jgi:hypothetical protein
MAPFLRQQGDLRILGVVRGDGTFRTEEFKVEPGWLV